MSNQSVERTKKINLILIAPHVLVLESLRLLLECSKNIRVSECFVSIAEMLAKPGLAPPDILLLHLIDGDAETVNQIRKVYEVFDQLKLIALTSNKDLSNQTKAVQEGAVGIVEIEQSSRTLLEAIQQVRQGSTWINHKLLYRILNNQLATTEDSVAATNGSNSAAALTEREMEVVSLIGRGFKNKDIAKSLVISEATVRHHLSSIYGKLDLPDRLNLVIYAFQHGLIKSASNKS